MRLLLVVMRSDRPAPPTLCCRPPTSGSFCCLRSHPLQSPHTHRRGAAGVRQQRASNCWSAHRAGCGKSSVPHVACTAAASAEGSIQQLDWLMPALDRSTTHQPLDVRCQRGHQRAARLDFKDKLSVCVHLAIPPVHRLHTCQERAAIERVKLLAKWLQSLLPSCMHRRPRAYSNDQCGSNLG